MIDKDKKPRVLDGDRLIVALKNRFGKEAEISSTAQESWNWLSRICAGDFDAAPATATMIVSEECESCKFSRDVDRCRLSLKRAGGTIGCYRPRPKGGA